MTARVTPITLEKSGRSAVRRLTRTIDAVETNDGDGVKIRRIGGRQLSHVIDSFLMLDEINSDDAQDYVAGC